MCGPSDRTWGLKERVAHGVEKRVINLVMRFVGNLTTWREILTFDIKKYIRNGGKCNYIPGKNAFFFRPWGRHQK